VSPTSKKSLVYIDKRQMIILSLMFQWIKVSIIPQESPQNGSNDDDLGRYLIKVNNYIAVKVSERGIYDFYGLNI